MWKMSTLMIVAVLSGILAGCAGANNEKPMPSALSVEIVPTPEVTVTSACMRVSGEQLLLSGKVRRHHPITLPGHVDVDFLTPDGKLIGKKRAKVSGLNRGRRGLVERKFLLRLDAVPPAGCTVRVRYHAPPFGEEVEI